MNIVILAGGSGTRFWPLSRKKNPKQLMSVFGETSMLQRTVERVLPLEPERIFVVTNALQAEETERQLASYGRDNIFVVEEPLARNTAPAIALAARLLQKRYGDVVMVVIPADHYISREKVYLASLKKQELGVPSDACLEALLAQGGIVSATGKPGSVIVFDSNVMHGSNSNITPFPRSNLFFVYNSC